MIGDRRDRRNRIKGLSDYSFKYLLYLAGGVLVIVIITFIITFISYNNKLKSSQESIIALDNITKVMPDEIKEESKETSIDIAKTIDEVINIMENSNKAVQDNLKNSNQNITSQVSVTVEEPKVEPIPDPEFSMPVEGEIGQNFAKDNLVYSETLQEWARHLGIDIKADRTTVIKASEGGTVVAIKNDPRYGLTIIIEHVNGFKTIYSNLLTTEFVSEGEKIEKGQSIGTVGNSAAFEIVDPPHLHFEILKDEVHVDPMMYIK